MAMNGDEQLTLRDWSLLQHAHGDASDVPEKLVALGSDDASKSNAALEWLYDSIWHQGTVYNATIASMPVLLKIADDVRADRSRVIEFLVALAIGCEIDYLPFSYAPSKMVAQWEEKVSRLSKETLATASVGPHIDLAVFQAVERNVQVFHHGLRSNFARHRSASVYGMSWFPSSSDSIQMILSRIRNGLNNVAEYANTLLAYGLLAFSGEETVDHVILSNFQMHPEKTIRTAAAIASASSQLQSWSQRILDEASRDNSLENLYPDILYFDGNLAEYASAVLEERS
jgi:hypothetical protein